MKRVLGSPVTTICLSILLLTLCLACVLLLPGKNPPSTVGTAAVAVREPETVLPIIQEVTDEQSTLQFSSADVLSVDDSAVNTFSYSSYGLLTAAERIEQNGGKLADEISQIYTSSEITGMTFEGLGTKAELESVLSMLRGYGCLATFFIPPDQLVTEEDAVRRIVNYGHQVGFLVDMRQSYTVTGLAEMLLSAMDLLQSSYGYQGEGCLRATGGAASSQLRECASALGWPIIGYSMDATPEAAQKALSAQQLIELTMDESMPTLQRGGIANFELGYLTRGDKMLSDYLRLILDGRNPYKVVAVSEMMRDLSQYVFPLPDKQVIPEVLERISVGHVTLTNAYAKVKSGFIGCPTVTISEDLLPGYTYLQREGLDRRGRVQNQKNQVFITFDGWASDTVMNELLGVLEKHRVKSTFFLLGEEAEKNPNLVRTIAVAGHEIGSNTYSGSLLAASMNKGTRSVNLKSDEIEALENDIIKGYAVLMRIVGDMYTSSSKPVMTPYFRPVDFVIGSKGLEAVMNVGFKKIIMGCYASVLDKDSHSASEMAVNMRKVTQSGSIIALTLSDETDKKEIDVVKALDMYLSRIETDEKNYRFVRLSDAL